MTKKKPKPRPTSTLPPRKDDDVLWALDNAHMDGIEEASPSAVLRYLPGWHVQQVRFALFRLRDKGFVAEPEPITFRLTEAGDQHLGSLEDHWT